MGFVRRVLHVVLVAGGVLLVAALFCFAVLTILSLIWPGSGVQASHYLLSLGVVLAFTMLIGMPAIAAIALIYAALERYGQARWYFVIPLALVPGVLMLRSSQSIGVLSLVAGAFVGTVTHVTMAQMKRQAGQRVVV